MATKKWESLKNKALIAALAIIPAITSGVVAYSESQQTTKKAATQAAKKAEAGYQVTRAAYEQMLKDIATLKAEIRMLEALVVHRDHVTSSTAEPLPDLPEPAPEVTDIHVKRPESETTVTLKKGDLPEDLDTAQKVLE